MKVKRRVHFEEILGTELGDKRPPGCSGTWDRLKNSAYKGVSYFCSEFNGPDKWGDVPVTMAVKGGRLSVVKVQLFFDDTSGAKDEFQDLTGELIGRCDQLTGFDRNAIFDCGDYVADVEWFPGHDSAQLQVVYARSMESLDKDIEPED